MSDLFEELKNRGLVFQNTPGVDKLVNGEKQTFYFGVDATAPSLTIFNLIGATVLKRLYDGGHDIIVLVGGGTSLIGDPSGKDAERPMQETDTIERNKKIFKKQFGRFFEFDDVRVRLVDNADWLGNTSLINFLRDAGKYISVNSMIDKDVVKSRLDREHGISYAEFSYQLLQAYDFMVLYQKYGCRVQLGGSDQYGNMIQGVELLRKRLGVEAHVLSWPLIVNPKTGKKFGKTEAGAAIWLDPEMTHPYAFYQFFVNVDDSLAPILMKFFSFRPLVEIEEMIKNWEGQKQSRDLQKNLAFELVTLIHGKELAEEVQRVSEKVFTEGIANCTDEELDMIKNAIPTVKVASFEGLNLVDISVQLGLVPSKSEANRLVAQEGLRMIGTGPKYRIISKGKKNYGLVELKS